MPVRTKQLAVGDSQGSSGSGKVIYTCPAGETCIVKDIRVWAFPGGPTTRAEVIISGPSGSLHVFDKSMAAQEVAGVTGFMCLKPGDTVRLLSSGPKVVNPLEALASRRFDQVLAMARGQADFVLVDTAPAGALADSAVLAPRLEGMLLVISAGRTKRDLARRAREQLERVNANLLGVVLTDVTGDDKLYRY